MTNRQFKHYGTTTDKDKTLHIENCKCECLPGSNQDMDRGSLLNRHAWLGSQIVTLSQDIIPGLEKQARKTPPKTLTAEWAKVQQAQQQLPIVQAQLQSNRQEQQSLQSILLDLKAWGVGLPIALL